MDPRNIIAHRVNKISRALELRRIGISKIECDILLHCDGKEKVTFYIGHPRLWRQAGIKMDQYDRFVGDTEVIRQTFRQHEVGGLTTLGQFINVASAKDLQVFVDLKWHQGWMPKDLAKELNRILTDRGHVLISYDRGALSHLRHYYRRMRLGILTCDMPMLEERAIWVKRVRPDYIFFATYCVPRWAGRIGRVKTGLHLVNDKSDWKRAQRLLGDNCLILTDKPEDLLDQ